MRLAIMFAVGLVLGALLAGAPKLEAQAVNRLYGTLSTGAPIALRADSSGNLSVSCQ